MTPRKTLFQPESTVSQIHGQSPSLLITFDKIRVVTVTCLYCRSFHVDQTFLDFYNDQITKIESDIQIYQKSGRNRSIEIIQPKLRKYKEIRDGIINYGGIYGHPKSRRESKN